MTRRTQRAAAATAVAAALAGWVLGVVLAVSDGHGFGAAFGIGGVAFAVVGALVVWQRPENRLGSLFCVGGVVLTLLDAGGVYSRYAAAHPAAGLPGGLAVSWLADAAAIPTTALFGGIIPQLFPDGRVLSRRWRPTLWCGWAFIALATAGNALMPQKLESVPGRTNPYAVPSLRGVWATMIAVSAPLGLIALVAGLVTLILRWRRSKGDERQQLKWFLGAVALLPVPLLLHDAARALSDALLSLAFVVIPVSLGVAVLRFRLYNLNLVVRRSAAYAVVSAVVAGIYLGIVAVVEAGVGRDVSSGEHVIAAVAAAALFQPLRGLVQRVIDQVFYGDRLRPYEVMNRIGRQLEHAVVPENVLPGVVAAVSDALRVPYVAVELNETSRGPWVAAEHGRHPGYVETFPLTYQADPVGRLLVAPRAAGRPLEAVDRQLLAELARHVGVAAHAVQATLALQRSRADLITAREEERRRLRRELHEGLGPTLAGIALGLGAARAQLRTSPENADTLLATLAGQAEQAIADIRRVVYGLRPPALDELGLVRALQLHVQQLTATAPSLSVDVEVSGDAVRRLPAAVEVAAFRIASEALSNVVRHAGATTCAVELSLNGVLEIVVTDDGRGLPSDHHAGVGVTGMRERADELGGTLTITSSDGRGTVVRARLPIVEAP
ncbi:MAG TPA: sensor histidine kinase [Gemmatimonadaceae bacterium]